LGPVDTSKKTKIGEAPNFFSKVQIPFFKSANNFFLLLIFL